MSRGQPVPNPGRLAFLRGLTLGTIGGAVLRQQLGSLWSTSLALLVFVGLWAAGKSLGRSLTRKQL